jgi:aminoglycoside phosphotransferase (APT) family kinase protein
MNDILDKSKEQRKGEELPFDKIHSWLAQFFPDIEKNPKISQFTGGVSNWTYRLEFKKHDFILRKPPEGTKAASAHDMAREYNIQKALEGIYPVPKMIALCTDKEVIGSDFYIMERVEGIILRSNLPKSLDLDKSKIHLLCKEMLENLIKLHQIDVETYNLQKFGKGKGYCKRQIDGWSERYSKAHTWNVVKGKYVIDWLKSNIPSTERSCLIHNDYRFDNLIYHPQNMNIIGVLDWEMATIGDPMMDLGNTLAYWVQADDDFIAKSTRRQPTHLEGMYSRQEVIAYYCDKMNFDKKEFDFYQVYGLFRLAVIAQQIYFRYYHKQTNNKEYKKFWILVNYLIWRSKKLIKSH